MASNDEHGIAAFPMPYRGTCTGRLYRRRLFQILLWRIGKSIRTFDRWPPVGRRGGGGGSWMRRELVAGASIA